MTHRLSRRRFLQSTLALATVLGNGLPRGMRSAAADGAAAVARPVLANIMLNGGPDMRHLLMPPFTPAADSYGRAFWSARARSQGVTDTQEVLNQRWHDAYLEVADGATEFGILARAGWLYERWNAGKVAIICGVLGSSSRDHDLATRSLEMGERDADKFQFGSGWGGRLAQAADGNVVALTTSPRRFCFGPDPANPLDLSAIDNHRLIPAANTREIALPDVEPGTEYYGHREYLMRGLKQYYAERRATIDPASVYYQFFEHERKLRELGAVIDARLATVPVPGALAALFEEDSPVSYDLALQIRNLYDALACNDLLDLRVASLEFNGWDTHDLQREQVEPNFEMLLGANGALATLYAELAPDARANTTFLIGGEFGRQLADNGGAGPDHGEGTVMLLIGDSVQGGVYGTMFPDNELARLTEDSADIIGVNAIERVFGAVCDWVQPGSKEQVLPYYADAPSEEGFDLTEVFSA